MLKVAVGIYCFVMLTCFAAWPNAAGATLTGILYGDQGGLSGTATGEIRLAVNGQVYHLAYQRPYPQVFSSKSCRLAGARWTVEASEIDDNGVGVLISAQCKGDGDPLGMPAVHLVAHHLGLLKSQEYRAAYDLFASAYKLGHPFSKFVAEAATLDLEMYVSSGRCLEIVRNTSKTGVSVRLGIQCYINKVGEHGPQAFVIDVAREPSSNPLRIANAIRIVEEPRMAKRFPSEKTRDDSVEKAILSVLKVASGDYYFYNKVDLDGDGEPEVLVHVVSHAQCGFDGCNLLILKKKGTQYAVISVVAPSWIPIFASSERSNGWRDLIVPNEADYYSVLKFNGKVYPHDPGTQRPLTESVDATAYLANPRKPAYGLSFMSDRTKVNVFYGVSTSQIVPRGISPPGPWIPMPRPPEPPAPVVE